MVKEHTKVELCIFCLMSVSTGLKIASKVLNIKHFSGQLIINFFLQAEILSCGSFLEQNDKIRYPDKIRGFILYDA